MVKVQEAIHHGMIAADFLSNTKRVVQAIELWNECLTLLNNKILENEHELATIVRIALNKRLFYGNAAITKLSPAIESGKKLLVLLRNLRIKEKEGNTALMLSNLYFQKSEYQEAQAVLKIALCVYNEASVACQIMFYHNYPRQDCNNRNEIELVSCIIRGEDD